MPGLISVLRQPLRPQILAEPPKFRDKNIPEEPGHLYVESAYQEFDLGSLFHVGLMF
jgi:hypothetical protein